MISRFEKTYMSKKKAAPKTVPTKMELRRKKVL